VKYSDTDHRCAGIVEIYHLLTRVLYFLSGDGLAFAGAKSLQRIKEQYGPLKHGNWHAQQCHNKKTMVM
jgi:hypothetical protein